MRSEEENVEILALTSRINILILESLVDPGRYDNNPQHYYEDCLYRVAQLDKRDTIPNA